MPYMVNGVGTWYYGKSDVVKRPAICRYCGREATLESYNTILWVVVLLVPIIPLGRKRIIDKCGACTRHHVSPLRKYQQARDADVDRAVKEYCADPGNADKARGALGVTIFYRAATAFDGVAALVEQNLPGNAGVAGMIASGHVFFGKFVEAEAGFERALSLEYSDGLAEEYAFFLLRQKRPDDARRRMQHLFDTPSMKNVPLLFYLVDVWQTKGQHAAALEALNHWADRLPTIRGDNSFKRYLARALKYQHTNKALKPLGKQTNWVVLVVLLLAVLAVVGFILLSR